MGGWGCGYEKGLTTRVAIREETKACSRYTCPCAFFPTFASSTGDATGTQLSSSSRLFLPTMQQITRLTTVRRPRSSSHEVPQW